MVRVMVICDKYYGVCGEYQDGEDGGDDDEDGGENYEDVDYKGSHPSQIVLNNVKKKRT